MGLFTYRVGFSDGNGGEVRSVEAVVDTGSTFSALPASLLKELGIVPHRHETFTLANDTTEELPVGDACVHVGEKRAFSPVIFGAEGQYLLGATSLQALALIADTSNHTLIPSPDLRW